MTETKQFTGPTLEAAGQQAKEWILGQSDLKSPLSTAKHQHLNGARTVFIFFQRTPGHHVAAGMLDAQQVVV